VIKKGSGQKIKEELLSGIQSRPFLLLAPKEKELHHRACSAHLSVFSSASSAGSLLCIASLL